MPALESYERDLFAAWLTEHLPDGHYRGVHLAFEFLAQFTSEDVKLGDPLDTASSEYVEKLNLLSAFMGWVTGKAMCGFGGVKLDGGADPS